MDMSLIHRFFDGHKTRIVAFIFIVFLFTGIAIHRDYGNAWDQKWNRRYGLETIYYIATGEEHALIPEAIHSKTHGSIFEVLLISLENIFNLTDSRDIIFLTHLCIFLLFYVSLCFFYRLCACHFNNWKIGLLGALFLMLSPRIFAHAFYNTVDIAFMALFIISYFTLCQFVEKKDFASAMMHALTCAFLIGIRHIGIFVPFLTVLMLTFFIITAALEKGKTKYYLMVLFVYLSLLFILTVLFWPYLWGAPIERLIASLSGTFKSSQRLGPGIGIVLYLGKKIPYTELPWHYNFVWILITTPLLYVVCFFIGFTGIIKSLFKGDHFDGFKQRNILFLLWLFVPLCATVILKSATYNGWRHHYFVYPAFIVIACTGLQVIGQFIQRMQGNASSIVKFIFVCVISSCLVVTGVEMFRMHPYQNVYFNALVGKQWGKKFCLDYWGLSIRKAYEYILAQDARELITIHCRRMRGADYGAVFAAILTQKQRQRLMFLEDASGADYVVDVYGVKGNEERSREEFYSIQVSGQKICAVWKKGMDRRTE